MVAGSGARRADSPQEYEGCGRSDNVTTEARRKPGFALSVRRELQNCCVTKDGAAALQWRGPRPPVAPRLSGAAVGSYLAAASGTVWPDGPFDAGAASCGPTAKAPTGLVPAGVKRNIALAGLVSGRM